MKGIIKALQPTPLEKLKVKGREFYEQNNFIEAEETFSEALKIKADDLYANFMKFFLHAENSFQENLFLEAIQSYEEIIKLLTKHNDIENVSGKILNFQIGLCNQRLGNYQQALEYFNHALSFNETYTQSSFTKLISKFYAWNNDCDFKIQEQRAIIHSQLGDYQNAMNDLTVVLTHVQNNSKNNENRLTAATLLICEDEQLNLSEARNVFEDYKRVQENDPNTEGTNFFVNDAQLAFLLAQASAVLKNYQAANIYLEKTHEDHELWKKKYYQAYLFLKIICRIGLNEFDNSDLCMLNYFIENRSDMNFWQSIMLANACINSNNSLLQEHLHALGIMIEDAIKSSDTQGKFFDLHNDFQVTYLLHKIQSNNVEKYDLQMLDHIITYPHERSINQLIQIASTCLSSNEKSLFRAATELKIIIDDRCTKTILDKVSRNAKESFDKELKRSKKINSEFFKEALSNSPTLARTYTLGTL